LGLLMPSVGDNMIKVLRPFIERPVDLAPDTSYLPELLGHAAWETLKTIALPLFLLARAGISATALQTRFHASVEHIKPKFSKLSPGQGVKRLFGKKAWVEFAKNNAKLLLVGIVAGTVLWPEFGRLSAMTSLPPSHLFGEIRDLLLALLIAISVALLVIAALDYGFQFFHHKNELKMSKQDVKYEHKKLDGNPEIKAKRRQ